MAYKSLSNKPTKTLSKPISENIAGKSMGEGRNETVITSIVPNDSSIKVEFRNAFGEQHYGNIFLTDKSGDDLSYRLKELLSSVVTSTEELENLYEAPSYDALINRPVGIVLESSDGYHISRETTGFSAEGETFRSLPELKKAMSSLGKLPSYLNITEFYRTGQSDDKRPDLLGQFIGNNPDKTEESSTTKADKSIPEVDKKSRRPNITGWL